MEKGAILSDNRQYRYCLWRIWDNKKSLVMFIGLNPSTADENHDDRTIKRCIGFAKEWGYGGIYMTNLFAYRSTSPKNLYEVVSPIGDNNDRFISEYADRCKLIIACWGNHGRYLDRSLEVKKLINNLYCLELNNSGEPKHPLYVRKDQQITKFNWITELDKRIEANLI